MRMIIKLHGMFTTLFMICLSCCRVSQCLPCFRFLYLRPLRCNNFCYARHFRFPLYFGELFSVMWCTKIFFCSFPERRGVTMLDGARGKKQVWRPHVRIWGLLEAKALYWRKYCTCDIVRTFRCPRNHSAPSKWFGARRIVPSLPPIVTLHERKSAFIR